MGRQGEKISTADRIQAIRVYTLSEWSRLLAVVTDPKFTGSVSIELSAKDGRPGQPKVTQTRYGIQG